MGDLDVALIKEFAKRPGFYNRGDIHFKDKLYAETAWNEISSQLGYDVVMLKDRIYQLRNRYNLEKRRLEQIKYENPSSNVTSPWRLFSHLQFLDGHIRPRRSYKTMMRRAADEAQFFEGSNLENTSPSASMVIINNPNHNLRMQMKSNSTSDGNQPASANSDSPLEIKDEKFPSNSEDSDDDAATGQYLDPSNYLANDGDEITIEPVAQPPTNGDYHNGNLRRSERKRGRSPAPIPPTQTNPVNSINVDDDVEINGYSSGFSSSTIQRLNVRNIDTMKTTPNDSQFVHPVAKKMRLPSRSDKYEAFGRFLTHSLCDLEEDKALLLVEKFTSEVVKALISNHNQNNPRD